MFLMQMNAQVRTQGGKISKNLLKDLLSSSLILFFNFQTTALEVQMKAKYMMIQTYNDSPMNKKRKLSIQPKYTFKIDNNLHPKNVNTYVFKFHLKWF